MLLIGAGEMASETLTYLQSEGVRRIVVANRSRERAELLAQTFRGEAERADADYLFVMEDDDGKVVGISAVAGAVGLREPWYNYRVGLTVSASQELKIHREIPTLFLANDLTGNSELCSLFLHAGYRSGLNGRRPPWARRRR